MKYLKKFESIFDKYRQIDKMIECLKNIEPDEETYNDYYVYDINFKYDDNYNDVKIYDKLKIYKRYYREDFLICSGIKHEVVYDKDPTFVNDLYEYFRERFSDYFNAIDMGLL